MKFKFFKIPVLAVFAVGALAQQPDRIQKDVKYLASDALEGRRTGTNGATEAAVYIAKEFGRLGLKPLASNTARNGSESRYLQSFPYVAGVKLGKDNGFIFSRVGNVEAPVAVETAGVDW